MYICRVAITFALANTSLVPIYYLAGMSLVIQSYMDITKPNDIMKYLFKNYQ